MLYAHPASPIPSKVAVTRLPTSISAVIHPKAVKAAPVGSSPNASTRPPVTKEVPIATPQLMVLINGTSLYEVFILTPYTTMSSRPLGSNRFTGSPLAYRYLCSDMGLMSFPACGSLLKKVPAEWVVVSGAEIIKAEIGIVLFAAVKVVVRRRSAPPYACSWTCSALTPEYENRTRLCADFGEYVRRCRPIDRHSGRGGDQQRTCL